MRIILPFDIVVTKQEQRNHFEALSAALPVFMMKWCFFRNTLCIRAGWAWAPDSTGSPNRYGPKENTHIPEFIFFILPSFPDCMYVR